MKLRKYYWTGKRHGQSREQNIATATSRWQLHRQLKQRGYSRIHLQQISEPFRLRKSSQWVPWLYDQLHCLIRAGMPLLPSLQQLQEMRNDAGWYYLLWCIMQKLQQGCALSLALKQLPRCFGKLDRQLIEAAELSGQLESTLKYLVTYHSHMQQIKRNVIKAVTYPAVVMFVSLLVCVVMLAFVVPKFAELFTSSNQALPTITQYLLATASWIQQYVGTLAIAILVAIALSIVCYRRSVRLQCWCQQWVLRLPGFKQLCIAHQLSISSYTLGVLMRSGVGIDQALEVVVSLQTWQLSIRYWRQVIERLRQGRTLAQATAAMPLMTDLAKQLITTGETSGQLPDMLEKIADYYRDDFANRLQRFTQLLEPISLVFIGTIVTIMMLALYMPMFQLGAAF